MTNALPTLVTLAWALWFGGTMALFLAVGTIFKTFAPDRTLAGTAAAGVFRAFERFQLPLAVATLALMLLWRFTAGRGRPGLKTATAILLAAATAAAGAGTFLVSPKIDQLRVERRTQEPAFRSLHGASMMLYTGQAALLLAAGLLIPTAIRREGEPKSSGL